MPLHAVSGSQLNRIAPSLESFLDEPFSMPKDSRVSYSRSYRTEPYPSMSSLTAPPTSTSPPRRESFASSNAATQERPSTAWTPEDDAKLMDLRKQGFNWQPVAENFHGKTANACRKRHERLMERQHNTEYDSVRTEELANAYFQCREQMWKILADYLNEPKWQTIENKCFSQGFKNLQASARQSRNRPRNPSPAGSDPFDDSALGHSPSDSMLALPQRTSQSPSSLRTSRENSSYPVSRTILEPPRAPILPAQSTQYGGYHLQPQHQHQQSIYSGAYVSQPLSLPPPSASVAPQTLPPLNQAFNNHDLPPTFGSRHISATYG